MWKDILAFIDSSGPDFGRACKGLRGNRPQLLVSRQVFLCTFGVARLCTTSRSSVTSVRYVDTCTRFQVCCKQFRAGMGESAQPFPKKHVFLCETCRTFSSLFASRKAETSRHGLERLGNYAFAPACEHQRNTSFRPMLLAWINEVEWFGDLTWVKYLPGNYRPKAGIVV